MNDKNVSLGASIYDYTTNYTLNMENISIEENADQMKAVLDMFKKNDTVFEDPANILVIRPSHQMIKFSFLLTTCG